MNCIGAPTWARRPAPRAVAGPQQKRRQALAWKAGTRIPASMALQLVKNCAPVGRQHDCHLKRLPVQIKPDVNYVKIDESTFRSVVFRGSNARAGMKHPHDVFRRESFGKIFRKPHLSPFRAGHRAPDTPGTYARVGTGSMGASEKFWAGGWRRAWGCGRVASCGPGNGGRTAADMPGDGLSRRSPPPVHGPFPRPRPIRPHPHPYPWSTSVRSRPIFFQNLSR